MEQKLNNDLFVGQTVWYKLYAERNNNALLRETKISKVGNKYFEIKDVCGRFFKQTLEHDGRQYSSAYRVYLDKETYFNELEMNKRWNY